VVLAGGRPFREVQRAYAASDLLVMPSRVDPVTKDRDGLPNVVIEASAAGLPVVATRIAGIPDLIEDGDVEDGCTGRLVDPSTPQALATAIDAALQDYDRSLEMARRARDRVHERYSLSGEVARLEAAIHAVHDL
jgi:glycosyltransferase involved in cell wall biosynthesis